MVILCFQEFSYLFEVRVRGILNFGEKIVNEYDQENHNHKLQTTPWHREEEPLNHHETPGRQIKQSNQLSLFPIKMISILERTKSNIQQNIEQLQTLTMGVTINKKSTTTEPPP